jgi:hypothetical protein
MELSLFEFFHPGFPGMTLTLDIIYYSRFVPLAYKNFISNLKTNAL